jgi:hypothetical protein
MTRYQVATKEQIRAKVRAMERHEAEKQAWMSNFAVALKTVTNPEPEEVAYLAEISKGSK